MEENKKHLDTARSDLLAENTSKRSISYLAGGAVVLALGVAQLVLGIVGTGRELGGQLFFPEQEVTASVAQAADAAVPFIDACDNSETAGAFDDTSVKDLESWCRSVRELDDKRTPEAAVAMLRAQNRHFANLTTHLMNRGGKPGEIAGTMLDAACAVRPPLEDVFSSTSGAAFSQSILGLILFGAGYWFVRMGRKRARPR